MDYASRWTTSAKSADGNGQRLVLSFLVAYLVLIVLCSFALRAKDVMVGGGELNYDRALFLSVSTATLTGFQQSIGFNDFNPESAKGPAILLILTIAGSLFAMIAGSLAAVRVLRLPFSDHQVINAALTAELLAVLAGTAVICGASFNDPHGVRLPDAIHQAACALGNSAAVMTSKGHTFKPFNSFIAQGVLLPLSILGGFGLPVLMELYHRLVRPTWRLSKHCRSVIVLSAGVYLAATVLLMCAAPRQSDAASENPSPAVVSNSGSAAGEWRDSFVTASTMAINTRTAGLPFDTLKHYSHAGQWLLVLLMMIGANSAGTAGGIKLTTFLVLIAGFRNVLLGRPVSRVFGIAGVWLGAYLLIAIASFLVLSILEPQMPADGGVFLIISALSNVGMSHDPVSIVGKGSYLLSGIMLIGRLAPLAVLWWMAGTTSDAEVLVA